MAAPTTAAGVKKSLANPEPSTHGPSRNPRSRAAAAAYWGSAVGEGIALRAGISCSLVRSMSTGRTCPTRTIGSDGPPKRAGATAQHAPGRAIAPASRAAPRCLRGLTRRSPFPSWCFIRLPGICPRRCGPSSTGLIPLSERLPRPTRTGRRQRGTQATAEAERRLRRSPVSVGGASARCASPLGLPGTAQLRSRS
jgi:hypothetical protein